MPHIHLVALIKIHTVICVIINSVRYILIIYHSLYTQKVFPLIVESIIYVCTCVCVFFVCSSHDGCLNPESTSEIENFGTMHIFSFLIIYTE